MPQSYSLARGSILVDIPTKYCPKFVSLPSDQRSTYETQFVNAVTGDGSPENRQLFACQHKSEFNATVEIDQWGQAAPSDLLDLANQLIAAYNARVAEYGLTFAPLAPGTASDCERWIQDPDTGAWIHVCNWGLTVASGNAKGENFNWLPLSEAQKQANYSLPAKLAFMLDDDKIVLDSKYHLTVSLTKPE